MSIFGAIRNLFLRRATAESCNLSNKEKPKSKYDLKSFELKKRYEVDLKPYLQHFLKEQYQKILPKGNHEIVLSSGRSSGFQLNGVDVRGVYRDGAYTMTLFKYPRPSEKMSKKIATANANLYAIACIGFDIDKKEDKTIVVTQIQGVRGKEAELKYYRWEKMLLKILIDWADANEYSKIKVLRAEKNKWHSDGRHRNLYMKYDVTARRSGFKFDPAEDLYALRLT